MKFFTSRAYKILIMAKKIFFTSFKGGTGVTTCCVGVGRALAELGERTLICDGDRRGADALIMGDVRDMLVYTLSDYEKGACRAKQTIISHPKYSNLHFMSSLGLKDEAYAKRAVEDLEGLFDYLLLDKFAPETCDSAVIVTDPFPYSVKSADVCRSALWDGGVKDIKLMVNKLSAALILSGESMTAKEISTLIRVELAAAIPEDLSLPVGRWRANTLAAFKSAAENLTGKSKDVHDVLKNYRGLRGYLKRKLREHV